jgi:predicted TIM-barrel fold metal-dependent hydrolase
MRSPAYLLAAALAAVCAWGCSSDEPARPTGGVRHALEAENALLRHRLAHPGEPAPAYAIVNVHEHLLAPKHARKYLAAARAAGIRQTVFVASPPFTLHGRGATDTRIRENLLALLRAEQAHPDEIIPFTSVSPTWDNPLAALRHDLALGARGLKLYSGHSRFHSRPLDTAPMMPVYAFAEEVGLPLLWHVRLPRYLDELEAVLRAHPHLNVVIAHYGVAFWNATPETFAMLRGLLDRHPHLLFDTSLGTRQILVDGLAALDDHRAAWRALVMAFPDRFVMGTDMVITGHPEKTTAWILRVIMACRDQLERSAFFFDLGAAFSRYHRKGWNADGRFRGFALPPEVLRQIYETNPARWLGRYRPEERAAD